MPGKGERSGIMNYKLITDGACFPNPGRGGWAFIILKDDEAIKFSSGAYELTSNNRMELAPIIAGLNVSKKLGAKEIKVVSDSQYAIGFLKKVFHGSNVGANNDLAAIMSEACMGLDIEAEWERGHMGERWNEECDAEANWCAINKPAVKDVGYLKLKGLA